MPNILTWEKNGLYWKYTDKITGEELLDASTIVYDDPRFSDIKYKLVDFIDVKIAEVDKEDIIRLACQHRAAVLSNPCVKNAIVIDSKSNKLANKFVELFKGSNWEVQLFQNIDEANEWLGR
ncbi:MAG: hypothetical protein OEY78_02710 [Gammaproteobacteria bacterium]|nr:hypothetical protein [Gammaproteobacteria bacterium]